MLSIYEMNNMPYISKFRTVKMFLVDKEKVIEA